MPVIRTHDTARQVAQFVSDTIQTHTGIEPRHAESLVDYVTRGAGVPRAQVPTFIRLLVEAGYSFPEAKAAAAAFTEQLRRADAWNTAPGKAC